MRRWLPLCAAAAVVGLTAFVVLASSGEDGGSDPTAPDSTGRAESAAPTPDEVKCAAPRVTSLTARPRGEARRRVTLRIRADAGSGRIVALHSAWGNGTAAISDIRARRHVASEIPYSYAHAGNYRVSVVAESSSRGCGYMRSPPATLRVHVSPERRG